MQDSILRQENHLQSELLDIKQQFFKLLKSSGANDASYTLSPSIVAIQHLPVVGDTDMNTPRRPQVKRRQSNACRLYADLLIDQLLAQARYDNESSDLMSSSSDADRSPDNKQSGQQAHSQWTSEGHNTSANKTKVVADVETVPRAHHQVHRDYLVPVQFHSTPQHPIKHSSHNINTTVTSDVLTSSSSPPGYASSDACPASSETSSESRTVPDLEKELMSRMIYYSDFTIDRQKKLDQEYTQSNSQRCVEGADASALVPLSMKKGLSIPARTRKLGAHAKHTSTKRSCHSSSDYCESSISSEAGSLKKTSGSCCKLPSNTSSKERILSSQEKASSTGSSRGSRCSTHPLASSTLISDPSNIHEHSSQDTGSVYTWSLEDSSEYENLHQSFMQSKGRRCHGSLPRSHWQLGHSSKTFCSSYSQRSGGIRPATLIGADSPPQEQTIKASSLELTDLISESPLQSSSIMSTALFCSSSLPRTSTRICLFPALRTDNGFADHFPSMPELQCSLQEDHGITTTTSSQLPIVNTKELSMSPLQERLELPGKSSTSDSGASSRANNAETSPLAESAEAMKNWTSLDTESRNAIMDSILTDSPQSYDSSGAHAPFNSNASPVSSSAGKSIISRSSESNHYKISMAASLTPGVTQQKDGVFKVPRSPAWTVKRRLLPMRKSVGHVSTKTLSPKKMTPVKSGHGVPLQVRQKLSSVVEKDSGYHPPRIFDKKALVRKFKKFSANFSKREQIKTLANL